MTTFTKKYVQTLLVNRNCVPINQMILAVVISSLITDIAPSNEIFDIDMSIGYRVSCAVEDSNAYCWGYGSYGSLGTGTASSVYKPVFVGEEHTCALSTDRSVKCWGQCDIGQCGTGNSDTVGNTKTSMVNLDVIDLGANWTADQVTTGGLHNCALSLTNHEVKCWGYGYYKQLIGTAQSAETGDHSYEMGDYLVATELGVDFYPIQVEFLENALTLHIIPQRLPNEI